MTKHVNVIDIMRFLQSVTAILAFVLSASINAALNERIGGLAYYDDVADITWLADANYAQTSGYDADGAMTWSDANAWAASLNIAGVTGWRLPDTVQPDASCSEQSTTVSLSYGYNCTASEMGNLFYIVLGNESGLNTSGSLNNTGPFSNLQANSYWSATEYAFTSGGLDAWRFLMKFGNQFYTRKTSNLFAWAVHAGDVAVNTGPPPPAFMYTMQLIEPIPGDTENWVVAMNNAGQVVGTSRTTTTSNTFVLDSINGMVVLPDLPGGTYTRPEDINDAGKVVGNGNSTNANYEAFLWDPVDGIQGLGHLVGDTRSFAYGMNNSDQVVGYSDNPPEPYQAFLWDTVNGMVGLGTLPGFNTSRAQAINDAGQIVGYSIHDTLAYTPGEAFLWNPENGMQSLRDLPGGYQQSWANDINESNQVVGKSQSVNSHFPYNAEAFLWDSVNTMLGLGDLPGGQFDSVAKAINTHGVVVGSGFFDTPQQASTREAFVWFPEHGMARLAELVDTPPGMVLTALDINDAGQIAGYGSIGSYPDDVRSAFILTPVSGLTDVDQDSILSDVDNCPFVSNLDQADCDANGRGDACDLNSYCSLLSDKDGDGLVNANDNCPDIASTDQRDCDTDGIGNLCDADNSAPSCEPLHKGTLLTIDNGFNGSVSSFSLSGSVVNIQSTLSTDGARHPQSIDGGILLETDQPAASGSHSGPVTPSDLGPIDIPFDFFGNAAHHYQDISLGGIVDKGTGIMDMSGWQLTWGGAPVCIDPYLPGMFTVSGDQYTLDFQFLTCGFTGELIDYHLEGRIQIPYSVWCTPKTAVQGETLDITCRAYSIEFTGQAPIFGEDISLNTIAVPYLERAIFNITVDETAVLGNREITIPYGFTSAVFPLNILSPQADEDGDGLSNQLESLLKTDPLSMDTDGDLVTDNNDNCPLERNAEQTDNDADGIGDICDIDADNDGILDAWEMTHFLDLTTADSTSDYDYDGVLDLIEAQNGSQPRNQDSDYDGVADAIDNCPIDQNPGQENNDSDLQGDVCDPDDDNDGVLDTADLYPLYFNYFDGDVAPYRSPDNIVNVADYLIMQRFALGELVADEFDLSHGDIYPPGAPDGVINIQDLILHRQLLQ